MKKYINKYIIAIIICGVGLITSCKKYINEGPIDTPTDDNFWSSERAAESGLAGAYGLLRTALTNGNAYFILGDATANEFTYGSDWTLASLSSANQWNFNYVPYNESVLHNWTSFYQVISQCNLILSKVPNIPAANFTDDPVATKNQILGEAYFIRAYCYYYITQVWGQPVIVTQAYTDPINAKPIARSSDADGFNQVVSDLKKSSALLSYSYSDASKVAVQASKGSAMALLSKVYMWQKQYQLASAAADSVIQYGNYSLESGVNFSNIFKGQSPESIFEINMIYSPNQNEAQSGSSGVFSIFLADPLVKGKSSSWAVNKDLINSLYDTTKVSSDVRVKSTFYGLHSTSTLMVKYANVIYQNPQQQTLPFVSNNMVVLRLADILLLKAEADLNLGNTGSALTYLNRVRQRAGLTPYVFTGQNDLLYTIMDERGRELYGEGQWYFDLVRSGLITNPNYANSIDGYLPNRITNRGYLWPLDLRTLLPQDPLLTQNAWWAAAGQ
ncbi:RagB/SusD family nutrient uptake outer membrane protein [Mucilaginibacter sp. HC2]|uniref:RagB/SusD family nutrient uptake outer membrane protein n=1 Tax=Mucilaginibacter inviolabilis TaxID=2714892 RepID=UPI00140D7896|nr:RagB/SusD family nutrient uptake outer membrane protein [Mucilaginibacter inviolabilis]NHA05127.1 RagB/SusD family nutrient uptake outer membrane protein [Mucilaginibacter inviolabilis]